MTGIMRQMEEMEQKEKRLSRLVLAQLSLVRRQGAGMETRTWVRNVDFATHAMLGATRGTGQKLRGEGDGAGSEKHENKRKKEAKHTPLRVASKAKAMRRLWRRGNVPYPRKVTRPKSSSMKK
jgi:hypothetical protein